MLFAEAFEDSPALGRRAAGEAAKGLGAVELSDGGRHASRPAARVGTNRNRGSSEGGRIGGHELGRARNPRKLDVGRAAFPEVVVAAVGLDVFEVKPSHRLMLRVWLGGLSASNHLFEATFEAPVA